MIWDEKLRWAGFWILDAVHGKPVRKYYDQIRNGWKYGSSMQETEKKIQALIRHAVDTTNFYKDYPADTALTDLPVVNKETFRNHYDEFLSSMHRDAPDNREMCTSGSTGTPLRMIQNKDKINHNTAGGIFLGTPAGYYIGMKEAFIRVWVNNVKKSKFRLMQENLIMMDSSRMDEEALEEMLLTIKKKKVKCLVGYSSALGELSRYLEKCQNKKFPKGSVEFAVRAIIPISETMPEPVRRKLEEQFGCQVRSWYSNEENGIMGLQNKEDNGYHIDTESYYYEILKMDSDEPAEEGELGRIVITDLYNYAFPILRYDNGDTAVAQRREKDGRYQLYLTQLYGRRSDLIYDCKGKAVTPYIITNNLWDIEGVKQYRFIQEDVTRYTIWLNGDPDKMDKKEIVGRILPYLGEDAQITVEIVDEIPVLASGKRKYIENRCEKYSDHTGFCG
ncbi:MAG: phenylacetate--CoA ligase family protein [Clostridia bacterium]|nr:phenylacetate--CoA ligase family protein [Clostridia bacterium]NCC42219.1 phenylacetate--CoA ligase family protein [Clostridia bacterium]